MQANALSLQICHTVGSGSCSGEPLARCNQTLWQAASLLPQSPTPPLPIPASPPPRHAFIPFSIALPLPTCLTSASALLTASARHCCLPPGLPAPACLPPGLLQIRTEYVGVLARTLSAHIKTYLSAMERMLVTVMTQADVLGAPEGAGSGGGAMLGGLFGKATAARATTVGGAVRGPGIPRLDRREHPPGLQMRSLSSSSEGILVRQCLSAVVAMQPVPRMHACMHDDDERASHAMPELHTAGLYAQYARRAARCARM